MADYSIDTNVSGGLTTDLAGLDDMKLTLDGGTTSGGRPYFVMDLVKGVPITRYCDEHHLTPRQRL